MLLNIGVARRTPSDLVDLLLECHGRIRSFVALARAAAEKPDVRDQEVADACAEVARYFIEALPLHVLDEEESVLPRLRGHSPAVDHALDAMHAQHAAHATQLAALLSALSALHQQPANPLLRAELSARTADIEAAFQEHLTLEETVLFPAIRELSADAQRQIVDELRARRQP